MTRDDRMIGFIPAAPRIQTNHIDGPLLTFSDGQMHWLTWKERFFLWLDKIDEWDLQRKHRPDLNALTDQLEFEQEVLWI